MLANEQLACISTHNYEDESKRKISQGPCCSVEVKQLLLCELVVSFALGEDHAEDGACDDEEDGQDVVLGEVLFQYFD